MLLREFIGLYDRNELNLVPDAQLWDNLVDAVCVKDESQWLWFESAEEAEAFIEPHLNDEIKLTVNEYANAYENLIELEGITLACDSIDDMNEAYEAAKRGEDLSRFGW